MRPLTNSEVLDVWEQTRGQAPLRQAICWLRIAAAERSIEEWSSLPVGHVCHALFQLRSLMFGPRMPAVARCPKCAERVEFVFECDALPPALTDGTANEATLRLAGETQSLQLRLPSTNDILAARSAADLLARCSRGPVEHASRWLPAASQWIAAADPLSETSLEVNCPSCRHFWEAPLDIAAYLSVEIAAQARRLLREIHRLSSCYGWGEREILSLSATRRAAYLEMAGA